MSAQLFEILTRGSTVPIVTKCQWSDTVMFFNGLGVSEALLVLKIHLYEIVHSFQHSLAATQGHLLTSTVLSR